MKVNGVHSDPVNFSSQNNLAEKNHLNISHIRFGYCIFVEVGVFISMQGLFSAISKG